MIREALKLFLEIEGLEVHASSDGQQALTWLASAPAPDLILLDLMMPVMDGYEFLKHRKKDLALSDIPVVVISAFLEKAPDLDVQGFVAKPIDFEVLREFIERYRR